MSPKDMKAALESLPSGPGAYHYAYQETMQRIEGQVPGRRKLALQALSWITNAQRPLRPLELQHALATERGTQKMDEEKLPSIHDLVSICFGLVVVDDQSNIIRLVHYTTQNFFEEKRDLYFPDCHNMLGIACITYLSYDTFSSGRCRDERQYHTRLQQNPFYRYAARYLGDHVQKGLLEIDPAMLLLLDSQSKVSAAAQALKAQLGIRAVRQRDSYESLNGWTAAHFVACLGLCHLMAYLLEQPWPEINKCDAGGKTALWYASRNGHVKAVELLVKAGALPDSGWGRSPLCIASRNGHDQVVQILLKHGADLNTQNLQGKIRFLEASLYRYHRVIQLLLDHGADINRQNYFTDIVIHKALLLEYY